MKKSVLSMALTAAALFAPYAVYAANNSAPSAAAPQVTVPQATAPKAPDVTKKDKAAESAAPAGVATATSIKIPDIEKITKGHYNQAHVDVLVKNLTARNPQPLTPEVKDMIRNNLLSQAIVVQEARRAGLVKRADVKAQMDLVTDNVLVGAFLSDYFKQHPVTDADAKKEYDSLVAQSAGQKEYQVRHILVEKEDEAKNVIEQLKKGEAFDKLAKQHSKDDGSKVNGGDLGWSIPQQSFVKPFADAVLTLEKGKFTQTPVKSQFGFHIIQLVDTRSAKAPEFEQVKGGLLEKLKAKKLEQLIISLRNKSK